MSAPPSTATNVVIEIGPDARLVRLVRLAARSLATDFGFRADDLDDLALAIDELVSATLAALDDTARLRLEFEADALGVTVRGNVLGPARPLEIDDVARSILDHAVDRWTVGGDGAFFHVVRLGPEVG